VWIDLEGNNNQMKDIKDLLIDIPNSFFLFLFYTYLIIKKAKAIGIREFILSDTELLADELSNYADSIYTDRIKLIVAICYYAEVLNIILISY